MTAKIPPCLTFAYIKGKVPAMPETENFRDAAQDFDEVAIAAVKNHKGTTGYAGLLSHVQSGGKKMMEKLDFAAKSLENAAKSGKDKDKQKAAAAAGKLKALRTELEGGIKALAAQLLTLDKEYQSQSTWLDFTATFSTGQKLMDGLKVEAPKALPIVVNGLMMVQEGLKKPNANKAEAQKKLKALETLAASKCVTAGPNNVAFESAWKVAKTQGMLAKLKPGEDVKRNAYLKELESLVIKAIKTRDMLLPRFDQAKKAAK